MKYGFKSSENSIRVMIYVGKALSCENVMRLMRFISKDGCHACLDVVVKAKPE